MKRFPLTLSDVLALLALLLLTAPAWLPVVILFCAGSAWAGPLCVDCLKIRVRRPVVVRGPDNPIPDAPLVVTPLPDGLVRGFLNEQKTDAPTVWELSGPTVVVLPATPNSPGSCGWWVTSTFKVGTLLRGFLHGEAADPCTGQQHHWSMSYATSADNGMTWDIKGTILSYPPEDSRGRYPTGEGNATVIDGRDGYYYAYGQHEGPGAESGHVLVARAPSADPGPGNWWKWCNGGWSCPGNGGESDHIHDWGKAASVWSQAGAVMLLAEDMAAHGIRVVFSQQDKAHFAKLAEPLLYLDGNTWNRPDPTELYGYTQAMSESGSASWDNYFVLSQMWLPPGAWWTRYLVLRDVSVTLLSAPYHPQVGVALSRWFSTSQREHWSTTGPVPDPSYVYEGTQGYVMTAPPEQPSFKVEECVSDWVGHPDHILMQDGQCAHTGYTRLRTAGWVYQDPQPDTLPLYLCWDGNLRTHFASNQSNCDGFGGQYAALGYVLAD